MFELRYIYIQCRIVTKPNLYPYLMALYQSVVERSGAPPRANWFRYFLVEVIKCSLKRMLHAGASMDCAYRNYIPSASGLAYGALTRMKRCNCSISGYYWLSPWLSLMEMRSGRDDIEQALIFGKCSVWGGDVTYACPGMVLKWQLIAVA